MFQPITYITFEELEKEEQIKLKASKMKEIIKNQIRDK